MIESMLTTIDNPYDPFDNFDQWFAYDTRMGYYTLSLLARSVVMSDDLSEADQKVAINLAMNEIIKENVSGLHQIVSRERKNIFTDTEQNSNG